MAKKSASDSKEAQTTAKPSALVDTRVVYCGDNLDQLRRLPPEGTLGLSPYFKLEASASIGMSPIPVFVNDGDRQQLKADPRPTQ